MVEKARAELAAKQPPPPAPKAKSAAKPVKQDIYADRSYDFNDQDTPATAPSPTIDNNDPKKQTVNQLER